MSTWILLSIVVVVAGILVYALRREQATSAPSGEAMPKLDEKAFVLAEPVQLAEPKRTEPDPVPVPPPVASLPPNPVVGTVRKRKPKTTTQPTPPLESQPAQSPIAVVLELLKDRRSLASAWLLREIFDAPRSRRSK